MGELTGTGTSERKQGNASKSLGCCAHRHLQEGQDRTANIT
jgi:hypothetical protein